MQADGSIIISTDIDDKNALNGLNDIENKIDRIKKSISSMQSKRDPLLEKAKEYGAALDEARAKLEELKSEQAKIDAAMSSGSPAEFIEAYAKQDIIKSQLEAQEATVKSLEKQYDTVDAKVQEYERKLASAAEELEKNRDDAGDLSKRLAQTADNGEKMAEATSRASSFLDKFGRKFKNIALSVAVFSVARKALRSFFSYIGDGLMASESFRASLASLKGSLASAFQPIFTAIAPAIRTLINWLSTAMSYIGAFLSMLFGTTLSASKKAAETLNSQKEALSGVGGAAEDAAKQLAGFDEINKLENTKSAGGGGAGGVSIPEIDFGMTETDKRAEAWAEELKVKLKPIIDDIVDFIVSGLVGLLTAKLTGSGGLGSIAAGVTLAIENINAILSGKYSSASGVGLLKSSISGALIGGGLAYMLGGSLVAGGLIGAVVMIAITEVIANWDELKGMASGFWDTVKGLFTGDEDLKSSGLQKWMKSYFNLDTFDKDSIFAKLGFFDPDVVENARKALEEPGSEAANAFTTAFQDRLSELTSIAFGSEFRKNISDGFSGAWETIKTGFEDGTLFGLQFRQNISNIFSDAWGYISGWFSIAWSNVKNVWSGVTGWFKTNIIDPVSGFFSNLGKSISGWFSLAWTNVKTTWNTVVTWFNEKIITPVKNAFKTATESISGFFSKLWESVSSAVKTAMNAVISAVESVINFLINGLNTTITGINTVIQGAGKLLGQNWSGIGKVSNVKLPRLADGAVIPANREFLAVLGDQKRGTNIEAPLSTIEQAVRNVLGDGGNTGGDIVIRFEGNLAQLGRVLNPVIEQEKRRRGTRLAGAY